MQQRSVLSSKTRYAAGVVCGLAAAAIWGGGAVVSRYLVTASLDPADLTLLRYLGCFPAALVLILLMGERMRPDIGWPRLLVLLLLAGPPYQLLVVAGYRHAPAGVGSLLLCGLLPLFALGIASALRGARPSWSSAFGLALVLTGLVLFSRCSTVSLPGILIFSAAALAWAILNECVRRWRVHALGLTISLALLAPLFIPLYLVGQPSPGLAAPVRELMLQLTYHGWLVAIGSTALFFASVRLAGATAAAILQTLAPVFAAGFGAALLGEPMGIAQGLGLLLTLAGVLVSMRALRRAQDGGPEDLGAALSWLRTTLGSLDPRLRPSRWL